MERIKEELRRYKVVLLVGVVVALVVGIGAANLKFFYFMAYQIKGDTASIVALLEADVDHIEAQDNWYFTKGTEFLLNQSSLSEEAKTFFEDNFLVFNEAKQLEIIAAYNEKNIKFDNERVLIDSIISHLDQEAFVNYLKRMEPAHLESALDYYFGEKIKVDVNFINELASIIKVYPQKLPFETFQFSLYDLLALEDETLDAQKQVILNAISGEKSRGILFNELKDKSIDGDVLYNWVNLLNQSKFITSTEYSNFKAIYSEVFLIRENYSTLDEREAALKNKKENIELQLKDSQIEIESKNKTIASVNNEIATIDQELESLTNYAHMALMIEKSAGTGAGEYVASIPKKSLFSETGYKPSSQKYIVKLDGTQVYQENALVYIDVYLQGTKLSGKGKEYPYYVEVSSSKLARINELQNERSTKVQAISNLKTEITALENKIANIKAETGYEQNEQDLKNIGLERKNIQTKLGEKALEINNLFGIGGVTVQLEPNSQGSTKEVTNQDPSIQKEKEAVTPVS